MRWIGAPFRFLYKLYFGAVYLTSGLLLYPYFLIVLRGEDKYRKAVKVKKLWSNIICIFCVIRVKVEGKDNFPQEGPFIVCANHASYLDIILMYKIIPSDFAFLGKSEVLKWPIINIFFKKGIDIPVDRSNRKVASESLLKAKEALRQERSLAIFPEGTMGPEPPKMLRFKNGAFSLALEFSTEIVPITFVNNYKLFYDHIDLMGAGRPGTASIVVHQPIKVTPQSDLVSLRNETYDIIKSKL
ncbi:MAG: 1-acyl-sn-glycerol-3-phosphate acyltransferase [Flavobacteriales bacterium]|nr:1-acyl-sn-glycerol-3-phosphate acyltransferase [Flavobacteriales bacterium]